MRSTCIQRPSATTVVFGGRTTTTRQYGWAVDPDRVDLLEIGSFVVFSCWQHVHLVAWLVGGQSLQAAFVERFPHSRARDLLATPGRGCGHMVVD
jgi:hypothetical protein